MTANKIKLDIGVDPYFKKVITYRYCRRELNFRVSQDLFSSFQVDLGTQLLLRTVTPDCNFAFGKVLDLGCGYGAIGLTLKAMQPECSIHMVDRDALAVEFSRQNAILNHLKDVQIYGSLDCDSVTAHDFDLIISNIPGKAGEPVITHMLLDAARHLRPNGTVAVVVVSILEAMVEGIIVNNPDITILEKKRRSGHTVFRYGFREAVTTSTTPPETDAYFRGTKEFSFGGVDYSVDAAYGLPEFDQLSYHTALALEGLKGLGVGVESRVIVMNPGVGHVPVALWKSAGPHHITMVDRDLLALRYAAKNLLKNSCPEAAVSTMHGVGVPGSLEPADSTIAVLREEEGTEALAHTVRRLAEVTAPQGKILLAAGSTAITRIVDRLPELAPLRELGRERFRGFSAVLLEPENARHGGTLERLTDGEH